MCSVADGKWMACAREDERYIVYSIGASNADEGVGGLEETKAGNTFLKY